MEKVDDQHLMKITPRPDLVMVRGLGSYLWDNRGRRYLDFIQGWAVNSLGHAAPELVKALAEQAGLLVTPSPAFHNAPQLQLAQRLARLTGLDQADFPTAVLRLTKSRSNLRASGAS